MFKLRAGFFETNSSSTHGCIIAPNEFISKFIAGEYMYLGERNEPDMGPDWELGAPIRTPKGHIFYETGNIKYKGKRFVDARDGESDDDYKDYEFMVEELDEWGIVSYKRWTEDLEVDEEIIDKSVFGENDQVTVLCAYGNNW